MFFKWINAIGMIAQVFIAGGVLYLLNIAHQEEIHRLAGFKNLSGNFNITIDEDLNEVVLSASVRNFGLVPQKIQRLESNKEPIQFFLGSDDDCYGWVLQPKSSRSFLIKSNKIEELEQADRLFLANNMERLQIASKEEIQKVLNLYREYIKKGAKYIQKDHDSVEITKWCNE